MNVSIDYGYKGVWFFGGKNCLVGFSAPPTLPEEFLNGDKGTVAVAHNGSLTCFKLERVLLLKVNWKEEE